MTGEAPPTLSLPVIVSWKSSSLRTQDMAHPGTVAVNGCEVPWVGACHSHPLWGVRKSSSWGSVQEALW